MRTERSTDSVLRARRVVRRLLALFVVTLLSATQATPSSRPLTQEDIDYMERIEKLSPDILLGAQFCKYGEILVIKNIEEGSFEDLLVVKSEHKAASIMLQDPPKLIHLADVNTQCGIEYIPSTSSIGLDYPNIASPTEWPFCKNGIPTFSTTSSQVGNSKYAIIGKPVAAKPYPSNCIGVVYQLHDGRLYFPLQKCGDWPDYTSSLCFILKDSDTNLVVRESEDSSRIVCEISRRSEGEPSKIRWPDGQWGVWPYMTEDNLPTLPNKAKFFYVGDKSIEPQYTYKDESGTIRLKTPGIIR